MRNQSIIPEGSKLHRHGDYYHLVVAEGGTGYGHMMTMARARDLHGPYEVHPENPVLTAVGDPGNPIQRAGHGDLIELDDDQVAVVYLASRPVARHSVLGRETFLAKARWCEDGWLRMDSPVPEAALPDFGLSEMAIQPLQDFDDFTGPDLLPYWNSLRRPCDRVVDLKTRPSWLCLKGTPSYLDSREDVALIARRVEHHIISAETCLEFNPLYLEQLAGLVCYYDSRRFYWLAKQWEYESGDFLALYGKGGVHSDETKQLARVPVPRGDLLRLGVDCDGRSLRFRYSVGLDGDWQSIGGPVSALILSDEEVETNDYSPCCGFTGAMIGLAAYDITDYGPEAAFDWFDYRPEENAWPGFLDPNYRSDASVEDQVKEKSIL